MRASLPFIGLLFLGACIDHPDPPPDPGGSGNTPPVFNGSSPAQNGTQNQEPQTPAKPALEVLHEAVYVLFKDWDGGDWMCTGALVAKDVVVTAGHCLDDNKFTEWSVVAPLAPNKPRVNAASAHIRSYDYENVGEPDIGFLKLEEEIELPEYAQLTDVASRIDQGENLEATTIVRTKEEFEAPFKSVDNLKLQSTTELGYQHGIATQMFSHGGDSGAGLYLVESGNPTHKLIGIARQPDPDSGLDHFTRIDSDFMDWFNETNQ
jgi:hypothetical protein